MLDQDVVLEAFTTVHEKRVWHELRLAAGGPDPERDGWFIDLKRPTTARCRVVPARPEGVDSHLWAARGIIREIRQPYTHGCYLLVAQFHFLSLYLSTK